MEAQKVLTLTVICTKFSWQRFSFYYTVIFTGLSTTKAIFSSFRRHKQSPRDALKYFLETRGKHPCQILFFYKTADLRSGALLAMRHFDRGVFLQIL